MKGLDKIIRRIRDDAAAELETIRAEGAARVAEVNAAYAAESEKLMADAAEKSRLAAEALLQRGERSDAMEQSKALLNAKQSCIDEAFAQAAEKLRAMPQAEYVELLVSLAVKNGAGDEELVFSAADAAKVGAEVVAEANRRKVGAAFTLSAQTRELEGGLVLKRGDVEVNCAFPTQLRQLRQTMAADVAAILFS